MPALIRPGYEQRILGPFFGIIDDVCTYIFQRLHIADNAVEKISLPNFSIKRNPMQITNPADIFVCGHGFKCTDDIPDCVGGHWNMGGHQARPYDMVRRGGPGARPYHVMDDGPYKIVSSIPYNITSDLLKLFLTSTHPPVRMCLVVQKEVADRIVAVPPKMSLLSVACQLYAECRYVATIKAGAFRPIPKVDSAILRLDFYPKGHPNLHGLDPERVIRIAKIGFSSKRKQLQKNLSALSSSQRILDPKTLLEQSGIAVNARAENLTVDEWITLVGKMDLI